MSELVVMPKADWVAALEATRAKTGKSDFIKSGELAGEINGISVGGGDRPFDCRSVTFMQGEDQLYVRSVGDGDTCADPVARGLIDAPTKEGTVDTAYTHSGWSTTDGGSASASALANVTADRTVYAAFSESVRKYTIRFYDGETLLTTQEVAYGGTASYTPPLKEGYFFSKWDPVPENITGDMDCYAQYKLDVDFATASWAEIAAIAERGEASEYFAIGDTKDFTFTDSASNTTQTVTVKIIGFDHDDLSDGSGKAGITLACVKTPSFTAIWASYLNSFTHYSSSDINSKATSMYNSLPAELKSVIKQVVKMCDSGIASSNTGTTTANYYLWSFSITELGGGNSPFVGISSSDAQFYSTLGKKYDGFPTVTNAYSGYPRVVGQDGKAVSYHTRQLCRRGKLIACPVTLYNGNPSFAGAIYSSTTASTAYNTFFGFCI